MNFDLSEEQQMLKDSIARFIQDEYDFETRRKNANSEEGYSKKVWQQMAELGWLSVPFTEEQGGFGGNAVDTMVVMEALGRGLVVEPFLATVLMFGGLVAKGSSSLQEQYISDIISGDLQGAFAYVEKQSRFELSDVLTHAKANGDEFILNGEKVMVSNGASADKIIVSARTQGAQSDKTGISLFVIDAHSAGVERVSYRLMDGQVVAIIKLHDVSVSANQLVGELDNGFDLMETIIADVMLAISAEAQGIMETLNSITTEYAKTREQFGVKIGSFQALQHRMVDMFMASEQCKSLLLRAVCSLSSGDGSDEALKDARKNTLALKVMVGRSGKLFGDEAIQLHGGMGLTDELNVGHYVKRLMMINTTFGDADYQQQQFSALSYG